MIKDREERKRGRLIKTEKRRERDTESDRYRVPSIV